MSITTDLNKISRRMQELCKLPELTADQELEFDKLDNEAKTLLRKTRSNEVDREANRLAQPTEEGYLVSDDRASESTTPKPKLYRHADMPQMAKDMVRNVDTDQPVSLGKFMKGVILGRWEGASAEKALEQRAIASTGDTGGSWLLTEQLASQVIPIALTDYSTAMQAGISTFIMETKEAILPKVVSLPNTQWKAENAKFDEDETMQFGGISLEAKTCMGLLTVSRELVQDSENIEYWLENALRQAVGLALDQAIYNGSGSGEPKGIFAHDNIQEVDFENADPTDYAKFTEAYYKLQKANEYNVTALVANPGLYEILDGLQDTTNQPMNPPRSWEEYRKYATTSITGQALMGDFTKAILGIRKEAEVQVSTSADEAFSRNQLKIRVILRADVGVAREPAFVNLKNIGEASTAS